MAQLNEDSKENNSGIRTWKTYITIAMTIALPVFDFITDIYTLHLYYDPNKPLMLRAFFASLVTILLHNVISSVSGLLIISKLHKRSKLALWESAGGKLVTVMLHVTGMANLVLPLEAILSKKYFDR